MQKTILLLVAFFLLANLGFADFDCGMEAFNQGDYATAVKEFSAAAEQGHAGAQFYLGNMYANGLGVLKDDTEALSFYQSAAEQGHACWQFFIKFASEQGDSYAQNIFGDIYFEGRGIPKNYSEAVRWYRRSAKQGNMYAQLNIGNMYKEGHVIPRNIVLAYKWMNLAASQSNEKARRDLVMIEGEMTSEQIIYAQQLASKFVPRKEKEKFRTPKLFPMSIGPTFYFKDEKGMMHFLSISAKDFPLADRYFNIEHPSDANADSKSDTVKEIEIAGTGFFVSKKGHILTNHHVVKSCSEIRVITTKGLSKATMLTSHITNDLALLITDVRPPAVAIFRRTSAELGEDVTVAGYPLHGLLGGLNITSGSVASVLGLRGDARYLQISAPVQPGNSGGPLLDSAGTVVGVVVAKLDAIAVAEAIGDIPQNVNFAIKGAVARSFLSIHGIEYQESTPRREKQRVVIAAEAQQHTVLLECWK